MVEPPEEGHRELVVDKGMSMAAAVEHHKQAVAGRVMVVAGAGAGRTVREVAVDIEERPAACSRTEEGQQAGGTAGGSEGQAGHWDCSGRLPDYGTWPSQPCWNECGRGRGLHGRGTD